ncbi:hypothetical protein K503DRAFT_518464 [Rhizopogon vinicolor AM-OR11-026]|uniref:DUF6533 domain-containing protein n=1 Tax=Rhizopogon vinicolor AM-OR11-026 TaxID=1314800 RepID=A0A1B7MLR0_9AGAM|nr:hypothetical protein K503DRAFT_518464 [Rhizopogon vinicolor AM-OR11-026]
MTVVSNDPVWWPDIEWNQSYSYFIVASSAMVVYDWALSFEQEVDLFWATLVCHDSAISQCSLHRNTVFCKPDACRSPHNLADRYAASSFTASSLPMRWLIGNFSSGTVAYHVYSWAYVVVHAMLCVILTARLHAMYQQSRKMLIFLIVTLLAVS